jgi:hypothetical protein
MPSITCASTIHRMHVTVSSRLEADRLRHRSRQIERVVTALRDRAAYRRRVTGKTPPAIDRAIADFDIELKAARRSIRLPEGPPVC